MKKRNYEKEYKSMDYFKIKTVNNGIDGERYQIQLMYINILEQLVWRDIGDWNKYALFYYLFSDENPINENILNSKDLFGIKSYGYKMDTIKELFDTLKNEYNADIYLHWKNKKDAKRAIEYLESLVVIKKLCE